MIHLGKLLATVASVACLLAADAGTSSGIIVTGQFVGDLQMHVASPADVSRTAGKPDRTWRQGLSGVLRGQGLPNNQIFARRVTVWGYGCRTPVAVHGCATLYAFQGTPGGLGLTALWTRSPAFRTVAGSRVGMPLRTALARERYGCWPGISLHCRMIDLSSGARKFKLDVAGKPPRVVDLMLSDTRLFADGC